MEINEMKFEILENYFRYRKVIENYKSCLKGYNDDLWHTQIYDFTNQIIELEKENPWIVSELSSMGISKTQRYDAKFQPVYGVDYKRIQDCTV